MDQKTCKERILSEDCRDFIAFDTLPAALAGVPAGQICVQRADFGFRCAYVPSAFAGPVDLTRFSYLSIPKCYAALGMDSLSAAGVLRIQDYPALALKGSGVMIGFIDTGIDYTSPLFRNIDGSTRVLGVWDQTQQGGAAPEGFAFGTEYTEEMINLSLAGGSPKSAALTVDEDGHGTYIAGVAAGGGSEEEPFLGAAPEAAIGAVKLKGAKKYLKDYYYIPEGALCFEETDILLGLKYLGDLASKYDMPLVICLALGTALGGHTGLSALSRALEGYSALSGRIPVVGAGNGADARRHFSGTLKAPSDTSSVEIRVGEGVDGFVMELWSDIPDILSVSLSSPSGESTRPVPIKTGRAEVYAFVFENTRVEAAYRLIVQRSTSAMVFFRFSRPVPGIWRLFASPAKTVNGQFHLWLPACEFLEKDLYFLDADPYCTLTGPADTANTITAAYCDGESGGIALGSGRGYTRDGRICPDIAAPGIDVKGPLPNGRFSRRSGSSPAAAITAGAAALLAEWLRFRMNVPRVDCGQIKSLLILGASRPKAMTFPNREWGYGKLDLYNTFKEIRDL